jgi:hypothetical protein
MKGGYMGTRKIVINKCYGGFGLSDEAKELYIKTKSDMGQGVAIYAHELIDFNKPDQEPPKAICYLERDDPVLVDIVEAWGDAADGQHAELKIVEIPDDVDWTIEEYDGKEWVAETHRTWR